MISVPVCLLETIWISHSEVKMDELLSCWTAEVMWGRAPCPLIPARLLYVVAPSSDSLSELSRLRAAIRLSFIFLCKRENRFKGTSQGMFRRLQDHKVIFSYTSADKSITCHKLLLTSLDPTHLGDPLFAPLADSFADTDHTLYSPV